MVPTSLQMNYEAVRTEYILSQLEEDECKGALTYIRKPHAPIVLDL